MKVVPNHNIITVKKEKLSLDGIKQFWIDCGSKENKYIVLSDVFSLLDVGKCVIFVHTRETCKELTRRMREKGHSVGILHGKDMERETRVRMWGRGGVAWVLVDRSRLPAQTCPSENPRTSSAMPGKKRPAPQQAIIA